MFMKGIQKYILRGFIIITLTVFSSEVLYATDNVQSQSQQTTASANTTEPANYKQAASKFASGYNAEDIKGICALFTPELVKLLPQDRMKLMIGVLRLQLGKLKNYNFVNFETKNNNRVARYKANFEHGELSLLLSLNNSNLIDFLWFIPGEGTQNSAAMFQKIFEAAGK